MSRRIAMAAALVLSACICVERADAQNGARADVDSLVARANMLRRTNRKAYALAEIRRAEALAPHRDDVIQLHRLLRHEVHGSEWGLGGDYTKWDDDRDHWRQAHLLLRRNTLRGPGLARFSRLQRFGLVDHKGEVEVYPSFPGGYGALTFGVSAGELYPRTLLSVELYRMLMAQVEGSIGYRRMNFPDPVDLATVSLGRYVSDYLLGARVYRARGGARGTAMSFSARKYLADDGRYVGAYAHTGSIREDLRSASDFDVRSTRSIGVEAHLIVRSRWLITARPSLGRDELASGGTATFHSLQLQLGARF